MATATRPTQSDKLTHEQSADHKHPAQDLSRYCREYARENPEIVALWCFGLGFVVGWRLKPW